MASVANPMESSLTATALKRQLPQKFRPVESSSAADASQSDCPSGDAILSVQNQAGCWFCCVEQHNLRQTSLCPMRMSHATGGLLSDLFQRGRGGASLHSVITDVCAGMARVPETVCPRARQRLKWVARGGIFSKTCVGVMKNR